jgi:hypothetical protein
MILCHNQDKDRGSRTLSRGQVARVRLAKSVAAEHAEPIWNVVVFIIRLMGTGLNSLF